tara:strand:+ start:52 stop:687 length:636 start_codon:yes stop_codon:yes gene_type:complete
LKYFRVKNFEKLQPKRQGKTAPWIRLYHTWNMDSAVGQLHDSHKAHYIGLLSIAHTENNRIPFDNKWIKKRGLFNSPVKLELFVKLGLIEILDNESVLQPKLKKPLGSGGEIGEIQKISEKNTFVEFYFDEFVRIFKIKPEMDYGTDQKILQGLANKHGEEKLKELITKFLSSTDQWISSTDRSVKVFKSQVQKLLLGKGVAKMNPQLVGY